MNIFGGSNPPPTTTSHLPRIQRFTYLRACSFHASLTWCRYTKLHQITPDNGAKDTRCHTSAPCLAPASFTRFLPPVFVLSTANVTVHCAGAPCFRSFSRALWARHVHSIARHRPDRVCMRPGPRGVQSGRVSASGAMTDVTRDPETISPGRGLESLPGKRRSRHALTGHTRVIGMPAFKGPKKDPTGSRGGGGQCLPSCGQSAGDPDVCTSGASWTSGANYDRLVAMVGQWG